MQIIDEGPFSDAAEIRHYLLRDTPLLVVVDVVAISRFGNSGGREPHSIIVLEDDPALRPFSYTHSPILTQLQNHQTIESRLWEIGARKSNPALKATRGR